MAQRSSLRAAERAAREAIVAIANAEAFKTESRLRALQRLGALIDGCVLELEAKRPAKPPRDGTGFEPVFI